MSFPPAVKKIWNLSTTVLVVLMVLCAVFLMGSRLIGYRVYNVISGSMTPTYNVGDLIYVQELDVEKIGDEAFLAGIKVGEPITFLLNEEGTIATHRLVRIDKEARKCYTRGDTNPDPTYEDPPVLFENVVGVPHFSIPLLGWVSDFVQHAPGTYITIGVMLVLIFLVFLPDFFEKKSPEEAAEAAAPAPESEETARMRAELEALRAQVAQQETPAETPAEEPAEAVAEEAAPAAE